MLYLCTRITLQAAQLYELCLTLGPASGEHLGFRNQSQAPGDARNRKNLDFLDFPKIRDFPGTAGGTLAAPSSLDIDLLGMPLGMEISITIFLSAKITETPNELPKLEKFQFVRGKRADHMASS